LPDRGADKKAPRKPLLRRDAASSSERDNILLLVELLDTVLDTVNWEVIFVDDDSPDGTAGLIREISRRDRRVRCLQRIGRRGTYDGLHRGRPGGLVTLISP
jgi:glycosyltransferase involved in cell wall biosynthesis